MLETKQKVQEVLINTSRLLSYIEYQLPVLMPALYINQSKEESLGYEVIKQLFRVENTKYVLRPEGTNLLLECLKRDPQPLNSYKYYYYGPMFRHERQQKGRYHEFYQFGIESIGNTCPQQTCEIIYFTAQVFKTLGIYKDVKLNINTLGYVKDRKQYLSELYKFCSKLHLTQLQKETLERNPLRLLDTKDPNLIQQLQAAPKLRCYLDTQSIQDYETVLNFLDEQQISYYDNPMLVRGLDYYNLCVFEWLIKDSALSVCSGGDYTWRHKGKLCCGAAWGMERLYNLYTQTHENTKTLKPKINGGYVFFGLNQKFTGLDKLVRLVGSKGQLNSTKRSDKYHLQRSKDYRDVYKVDQDEVKKWDRATQKFLYHTKI